MLPNRIGAIRRTASAASQQSLPAHSGVGEGVHIQSIGKATGVLIAVDAHLAAVIPAYNVARELPQVLAHIPALFHTIIVINDCSSDDTGLVAEKHAQVDSRILVIHHDENRGVGGAMITGFRTALNVGADIIVKIDGDGQMPLELVPELVQPLIDGTADYTKGNRFRDFPSLQAMPLVRRVGNVALGFLAKAATGYWDCFDPTNGFVAIRADVLSQLPLEKLDSTYFFETSMLSRLYMIGAVVREVPMPARYGSETSSLSISRVARQFPQRLLWSLLRRVFLKNFIFDFNVQSLHLLAGVPMLLTGVLYGGYNWWWYATRQQPAPTGTVVLSAMLVTLGVQFLLNAVNLDLQATPRQPINGGPIAQSPAARPTCLADARRE